MSPNPFSFWAKNAATTSATNFAREAATGDRLKVTSKSEITKAEEINQNEWGVCGFVAAVQAAHYNLGKELANTSYDTLFPLIKEFCENNGDIATELLDFSKTFGQDYDYKKLDEVIKKIQPDTAMEQQAGIAMTAKAMSRLCENLGFANYDFHGTTATTNKLDLDKLPYKNAIYGLGKRSGGNFRFGLLHWVYVDAKGDIMTLGKKGVDAIDMLRHDYDKITHYLPSLT